MTIAMETANCGGVAGGDVCLKEEEKHTVVDIGSIHSHHQEAEEKERRADLLSSWEMESLAALCDAFLPSVDVPNDVAGVADEPTVEFFKTSAAKAGTPQHVARLITQRTRHIRILLRLALIALSTWIGTLVLGGRASVSSDFPFVHKFSSLSLRKRQETVLSWSTSRFHHIRFLFYGMKSLVLYAFFSQVDDDKKNPSWEAIGYCGPDPDFRTRSEGTAQQPKEPSNEPISDPLYKGLVNMSSPRETVVQTLRRSGFQVSDHKRDLSRPVPRDLTNPSMTIRCDAVVVGSGSGGSVVAGELAKAGYKVLVLEKGSYFARSNLSLLEGPSLSQMYEAGGLLATQDNTGVSILAGSTLGGGSTINWSASIKTPNHVLREWSEAYDLKLFDSELYREALDAVCQTMGVQSEVEEDGLNNEVLRRGCTKLGYPVHNIPRNSPKDHYCGWCCMGCKDGKKKGTTETWLRDLVESNNSLILSDCKALRVLYSKGSSGRRGKARGVAFEFNYKGAKEVCIVESKVTVVACGALNTPVLLRKSGLKNPNIGKHLHLHPVVLAWGVFPERSETESPIALEENSPWRKENSKRSYEGGIMTAMSPVVANFEGSGYGALIQTPSLHPGLFAALMPWTSGVDIKMRMSKFPRTANLLALARDKGSGEIISQNPHDIRYRLSDTDIDNHRAAVEKMLRILVAAGAEEIGTHHRSGARINVKKASSHDLERFIQGARTMELKGLSTALSSAHQMGSCRMGVEPRTSAVDPRAETWEVECLFVADSSVFPTALGVNPMVTVMAISYCTAQTVLEVLKRDRGGP